MVRAIDILNASILIVDDQEANVRLLEQMLHGAGYQSLTSTMDPSADLALYEAKRSGKNGYRISGYADL